MLERAAQAGQSEERLEAGSLIANAAEQAGLLRMAKKTSLAIEGEEEMQEKCESSKVRCVVCCMCDYLVQ